MAQISMQDVKELRERTQAGLNDCRSALIEAEGNLDKAVELILKKGLAKSAKRAGAVATEGEVAAKVASDLRSGVIVEVNIQTDFASRNDDFRAFVQKVLEAAQSAHPGDDMANRRTGATAASRTIARPWSASSKTSRAPLGPGGVESQHRQACVHMGGRIGVLLALETGTAGPPKSSLKLAKPSRCKSRS
jgi:elongation factor Ts